ncbi:hypothetical protein DET56_1106 [Paenibacillus pabuli]|uniref:Uncharacterized protein n=1 Tax=Paenibacillus pabuli TaxID=1472 RepID=A0A855XPP1_9BACL|nr:hypothetical protein DET56_1106 [Paenibacillus pabuli]PXW04327.1 hypothetical protein DEU73_109293 [Paenibacillus taichungensis]
MTNLASMNPLMLSFPESFDTPRLTIRAPRWEMERQ